MIVRLADINKDKGRAEIYLIDSSNDKICLSVDVCCHGYVEMFYHPVDVEDDYFPNLGELREQKLILMTNISEIINTVFLLFNYDKGKIKSIEFNDKYPDVLIRLPSDWGG